MDPEITDNYGLTAAEWAEQAQEKKCARLLKEAIKKHTATLSVSHMLKVSDRPQI